LGDGDKTLHLGSRQGVLCLLHPPRLHPCARGRKPNEIMFVLHLNFIPPARKCRMKAQNPQVVCRFFIQKRFDNVHTLVLLGPMLVLRPQAPSQTIKGPVSIKDGQKGEANFPSGPLSGHKERGKFPERGTGLRHHPQQGERVCGPVVGPPPPR